MPRGLFDRLTGHDRAPRCRYDMATGRAEFVAAPLLSHESRATAVGELFSRIGFALADAGSRIEVLASRATRVLSDDGAFEPDEGLFIGASRIDAAERVDGWLDVRKGHPVPDLVVEMDRSTDSSNKLAPYFRMGVREAWTWSRRSGTVIWGVDPEAPDGFRRVDTSVVLPGVTRAALARLLEARSGADRRYHLRRLAGMVASKMLAPGDRGAMAAEPGT
jgi:Uma2 family endonuclease